MTLAALPPDLVLDDGDLVLRRHRARDADAVLEQCQDPGMQRWTTIPVPYTREHAVDFVTRHVVTGWADGTLLTLAVELDGRFAGSVDLRLDGTRGGEIGFGLAPWARGRGAMARAVRLLLGWAFDTLELEVVHWRAHAGNWASRRVAWACGFRLEGLVRGLLVARGERHDAWVASLRRGEPMSPRNPWLEPVVLHGCGVLLRPFAAADAVRVAEACSDPVTQRWLPTLPAPYAITDALGYIGSREEEHAAGSGVYWCVADPEDDRCIGSLGLMSLGGQDPGAGEVGYWTHPDARGLGRTTEAVRLAVRHGVVPVEDGGLGLARVVLRAAAGNVASRRVAEKAGFTEVGRDRAGERYRDGGREDFVRYDVLADEVAAR